MPKSKTSWWPWLGAMLLGAGGAAYWAHYRRPLPKLKGRLMLPELENPVEVNRDSFGVATIRAESWIDAWRALGFVHGQDRFFQMDMQRRAAEGRLSEVFGARTLRADRFLRRLGVAAAATEEWQQADEAERAGLEAYAQGVNAALRQQPLASEFALLRTRPQPWLGLHSLQWVKMMAHDLACNWEAELLRGRLLTRVGSAPAAAWTLNPPGGFPLTVGGVTPDLFDELCQEYEAVKACLPPGYGPGAPMGGSNAWVVSGQRSRDGQPLLANDPHLVMKIPDYWYQLRLQVPGYDLMGVSMPGLPGVILGQNGHLVWGVTNAYIDVQDLFIESIRTRALTAKGPSGEEPLLLRNELIKVRGQSDWLEPIYTTPRGPVISTAPPAARGYREDGQERESLALSLAWSGRPPGHFFRALWALNRASNVHQAREALRDWHLPALNFVMADRENNIAHQVAGRLPRRRPFSGLTPVPAWESAWAWQGYLEVDELPHLTNPECGFIVSANHAIAGPDYPHFLSWDFNPGLRAERIEQLLQEQELHDLDSFQAIQTDVGTCLGSRLRQRLRDLDPQPLGGDHTDLHNALQRLRRWDGQTEPESLGATIYESTLICLAEVVLKKTLGPDLAAEVLGEASLNPLTAVATHASRCHAVIVAAAVNNDPRWLPPDLKVEADPEALRKAWDGLLEEALSLAVGRLRHRLGDDPRLWSWGRLHQLELRHPLSSLGRLFPAMGPVPISGDSESPAQSGVIIEKGLPGGVSVGASWRYLCRLADLSQSRCSHCGGQSGHPGSPHYQDGFRAWLRGDYRRPMISPAVACLRLTPT